jgi:membrane-associated phospholipid phosphatase
MTRSLAHRHGTPAIPGAQASPATPGDAPTPRHGLITLLIGVGISITVMLIGLLAKTGPVAALQLRADRHIALYDRTSTLTTLARAASTIATPEIAGAGLMIVVPVILVLARRRLDALKVFCMFGGALALAGITKILISEHRPPAWLWAMQADSGASYPSGHVTTAAVLAAAIVVVAATVAGRATAVILGGSFAVTVAVSRVYLADHYPLDVLGGMLCALAAAFIVTGLAALPALQPLLRRLEPNRGRPH